MSAHSLVPTALSRAGLVTFLTATALGGTLLAPPEASAATPQASKALRIAASKKGAPYVWGAAGPRSFDCSGLVLYAFKKAGKKLPRTAAQQYNRTRHISASQRKRGDLVFFHSGKYVYHVGIYAGKGSILHSPRPGSVVKKEKLWTTSVWYGRVR
ncbi:C40 family peptidase [Streptomyces meridianus]|uniref:C40 family peptidase n=1 Tax=Streptomyces meridianus TaxID=2938945 RepID=A0ABT0X495_9ACTN|nr:C40 family peptidase [Streptomyces meridianus]MCM2577358.1 C40 family peptidase [Streptomyces meridianus]